MITKKTSEITFTTTEDNVTEYSVEDLLIRRASFQASIENIDVLLAKAKEQGVATTAEEVAAVKHEIFPSMAAKLNPLN